MAARPAACELPAERHHFLVGDAKRFPREVEHIRRPFVRDNDSYDGARRAHHPKPPRTLRHVSGQAAVLRFDGSK